MKRGLPLFLLSVCLDLGGVLIAVAVEAQLRSSDPPPALHPTGLTLGLGFLLLVWFFGGYSYLRWPWVPFWQIVRLWLFLVGSALSLALLADWLLNASATAVWFHLSTLLVLGLVLGLWGS